MSVATLRPPSAIYREEQNFAWWIYALLALMLALCGIGLALQPDPVPEPPTPANGWRLDDVVPAGDLGTWKHPPFGGEVADGYIWGRGAQDDKVATCGLTMAYRALRDLGIKLGGEIVFTHVGDEERGAAMGHRGVGVGGRLDLELAVGALDEPGPAAAELTHRRGGKLCFKFIDGTKHLGNVCYQRFIHRFFLGLKNQLGNSSDTGFHPFP